ncbi:MAG: ATP-binding cassette domain-containing protein [Salinibacterium sp.]|nr:oligopeptide/dipeptide ABC transporter ATP-binding protein [Salinibacterium sp.]MBF0673114.1 ATP-binding cassette domain-containing protein [Salinibacterium sp.]
MALLEVTDLVKRFKVAGGTIEASSGVSFTLERGETLALVGESGCGKSTTGRAVLQVPGPDSGSIRLRGEELAGRPPRETKRQRRALQMIFQDARSSLNPRRRVRDLVAEGLIIGGMNRVDAATRVDAMLRSVGLEPDRVGERRASEFSGGQCQRIAIARAMVMQPEILVCDEPVASLDVSVQAQVINLLEDMKQQHGLAMLFISHDLSVVRTISDRVAVMYLGRIVEIGGVEEVYSRPRHPYTRALLDSVPVADPHQPSTGPALAGDLPSPMNPPSGCRFRTRCPMAQEICATAVPELRVMPEGQRSACHFAEQVAA